MSVDSRTPTLEEVIRTAFLRLTDGVHTSLPGRIESYDSSSQKADIKPLIKNVLVPVDGPEIVEELPVLPDVPVIFPRSGRFFISLDLQPGDMVLLVFIERSIDRWSQGQGDDTNPIDLRRFSLADAVAIPGLFPFPRALHSSSTDGVKLGEDAVNGIRLEIAGGKLSVTKNGLPVVVFDETGIALGTAEVHGMIAEQMEVLWGLLSVWLGTHTHRVGSAESLVPTQTPAIPPFNPSIIAQKVRIPSG